MKRELLFSIFSLLTIVSILSLISATDVSSCQVINNPGYYQQTANLIPISGGTICPPVSCPPDTGSGKPEACPLAPCQIVPDLPACIIINVSGVVYNGQGYTITDSTNKNGILASNVNHITINNVKITTSNGDGINFYKVRYSSITNSELNSNVNGIKLVSCSDNKIDYNSINSNKNSGIYLLGELATTTDRNKIRSNTLSSNAIAILFQGARNNILDLNNLNSNNKGLYFLEGGNSYNKIIGGSIVSSTEGAIVTRVLQSNNGFSSPTYNNFTKVNIQNNNPSSEDVLLSDASDNFYFSDTPIKNYDFMGSGYGSTVGVRVSGKGEVIFVERVSASGTNLNNDIKLARNNLTIAPSLNKKARVTLYNVPSILNPVILKDNVPCEIDCKNLTPLNAGNVIFNVPGAGNYRIGAKPVSSNLKKISSCTVINESGSYVLTKNILGAEIPKITSLKGGCIDIRASNVNIDCKGFSISNKSLTQAAIYASVVNNISIRNCALQMSNDNIPTPGMGVWFDYVTNSFFENNTVTDTNSAVYITGKSTNNLINGNKINGGRDVGISLYPLTEGNTIRANTIDKTNVGLYASSSSNNTILFNFVTNGGSYGYNFLSSNKNIIRANKVFNGTGSGFNFQYSSFNDIGSNNARYNAENGMYFMGAAGLPANNNTLTGNTVTDNTYEGIQFVSSSYNTLSKNTISKNGEYGLVFGSSNYNFVNATTMSGNVLGNVYQEASVGNVIINTVSI